MGAYDSYPKRFRGISPRRRAERGTFDSSGGSEESTLRRADLSNPGQPLDGHPTSGRGRGSKARHYLRPDPHPCASRQPDRNPLPNPPSVGGLRYELHRLGRGGGGPPTRVPTAQPSPVRGELASRTPLVDTALVETAAHCSSPGFVLKGNHRLDDAGVPVSNAAL